MCRDFFLGSIRPKYYLRGSCPVPWEQGKQLCVIYQEDLGHFLELPTATVMLDKAHLILT